VVAAAIIAGGAFLMVRKITEVQDQCVTMEAPGTQVAEFEAGRHVIMREGNSAGLAVKIAPEAGGEPLELSPPSMSMTFNQYRGWRQFSVGAEGGYTVSAFVQDGSSEMLLFLHMEDFNAVFTSALTPLLLGALTALVAVAWGAVVFFRKT
jgi:hypothetical protein